MAVSTFMTPKIICKKIVELSAVPQDCNGGTPKGLWEYGGDGSLRLRVV